MDAPGKRCRIAEQQSFELMHLDIGYESAIGAIRRDELTDVGANRAFDMRGLF